MQAAEKIARLYPPIEDAAAGALPPEIQASLVRHRQNLALMVDALAAIGMEDATIEAHLSIVIESYRAELSAALHHLGNQS